VSEPATEDQHFTRTKTAPNIKQWLSRRIKNKIPLLSHLIKEQNWDQRFIFYREKHVAAKLC